MKLIKIFYFLIILSFIAGCKLNKNSTRTRDNESFLREKDTIRLLQSLELKTSDLNPLLDTVIFYNEQCPYYKNGLFSFFIIFSLKTEDGNVIKIVSEQDFDAIHLSGYPEPLGFFYYKRYLFIVHNFGMIDRYKSKYYIETGKYELVRTFYNKPIYYPSDSKIPFGVLCNFVEKGDGSFMLSRKKTCIN